jgi:osmotically-inducible protein OsmY
MNDNAYAQVRAELPYSHGLVRVAMANGRVTLHGEVDWRYQKQRAEVAVRGLPGVKDVRNLISIRPRVDAAEVQRRVKEDLQRSAGSVRAWAERRGA